MLSKIMSIRAALEAATKLEFEGVGELSGAHGALQDLSDIHTALMGVDELEKAARHEGYNQGGGNIHG